MTTPAIDPLISAQQFAYERVREQIFSGELRVGEPLRQEEIATRLGVSRLPLREALHRLASEGLVVLRPRRGYLVTVLDAAEIEDIFDVRTLLEERAGRFAARNRSEEDVRAVTRVVDRMDRLPALTPDSFPEWSPLNREFHARLYQASGRKHLCKHAALLRDAVEPLIRLAAMGRGELKRAHDEHHQMLDALKRRDEKRLGRLCRDHCAYTARLLLEQIKSAGHGGQGNSGRC